MSKSRLWDVLGTALASFWLHFACPAVAWRSVLRLFVDTWATLCRRVGSCDIDAPLERNRYLCRYGRQSWSHLAHKVAPERSKVASKGQSEWPGQSNLAGLFGLAVRVMETAWELPESSRDLHQGGGQSLSKRQDI